MSTQLESNLQNILTQKNTYLIPTNIRAGVTVLGVEGNLEPDKPDQNKSVTPSTSEQIVRADTGYELAQVTVNPVTASIDANITSGNIKSGVTVLGVSGNVEPEPAETDIIGVKPYKIFTFANDLSALASYYTTQQTNAEAFMFNAFIGDLNNNSQIPGALHIEFVSVKSPAMICITECRNGDTEVRTTYFFDTSYSALFKNLDTQFGLGIFQRFRERFDMTESQVLALSGWYYCDETASVATLTQLQSAPVYEDLIISTVFRIPITDAVNPNVSFAIRTYSYLKRSDLQNAISTMPYTNQVADEERYTSLMNRISGLGCFWLANTRATSSEILSGYNAIASGTFDGVQGVGKVSGTMPNNGALNITPSTSQQSIPAGYTSGGTVSAVTSSVDANITAGNIKSGVTILGVTGTFRSDISYGQSFPANPVAGDKFVKVDNDWTTLDGIYEYALNTTSGDYEWEEIEFTNGISGEAYNNAEDTSELILGTSFSCTIAFVDGETDVTTSEISNLTITKSGTTYNYTDNTTDFIAILPAGTYAVAGTYNGDTFSKSITVASATTTFELDLAE